MNIFPVQVCPNIIQDMLISKIIFVYQTFRFSQLFFYLLNLIALGDHDKGNVLLLLIAHDCLLTIHARRHV